MKKTIKILASLATMVLVMGNSVRAADVGSFYTKADGSCPILIKYMGTLSATATVGATSITLAEAGATTTINFGPNVTVADVMASIRAVTNDPTQVIFDAKQWCALSTDLLTNLVVASSAEKMTSGVWSDKIKWDTSGVLHYDCALEEVNSPSLGGYIVRSIRGNPLGTGALTLSLYAGDTLLHQEYHVNATGTVYNADWTISNFPEGIRTPRGKVGFIRAGLVTATTGGIGGDIER